MRVQADPNALNLDTYGLSLITAKEDILNDRISTDWAVFTYERKWSLKLMDSGVGGLDELTKKLNKGLVLYGLCRVLDPNTQGPRLLLIYWVGEHVDASRKEISVQHLPAIRRFFKEAPVMLRAHRVEDLSQEAVAQALSRVPQPTRPFHRPRFPGSHEVVGTNYTKTNPAIEMKFSKRDSFWQRNEREEEKRKEQERLRLQEERIAMEKARIERERLEEEERERRIQEKERMVEEQRKEQARLEAEQRRIEKARWAQQQKEFEEEMKGRFRRSQSIEMAAEAAALISGRSLHPRDVFRHHERSASCSNSPPSTPSSPVRSSPSFSNRTTFRYQRSVTESILTPPARSPSYFPGFQKRDSFSGPSSSTPPACSPAFIFSKAPLPGTSPKVDSLPSFIPPPISAKRGSPSHVKESVSPQSSISPTQSSGSSPQSSTVPPQGTTFPSQSTLSPQNSMPPPLQRSISPLQSTVPPQSSMPPPLQRSISPFQSTVPPQSSMPPPLQRSISPLQSSVPPPPPQSSLPPPPQRSISPLQSTVPPPPPQRSIPPPPQRSIPPLQSTVPPQRSVSPFQSIQSPHLYDVPYRAEYVTLSSEESPQPNNTYSEKKAPTRPPALHIPPSSYVDAPDATDSLSDVYRAEFVPIDSLNTSGNLVEPGQSPRSPHVPEEPSAIKATVSISTPTSEIAFASVTPVTDAKVSASPISVEAPGLSPPFSAKAIGRTASPSAYSTSAAVNDPRTLTSPPFPISAGKPLEVKPNLSYESSSSTKTTPEGLVPSPLPDSPITLEGKSSTVPSSLRSILQYVAPPPYTPFSARTESVTVKAPAFMRSLSTSSRLASSNSARSSSEISSMKAPSVEAINQPEPQVEPQEHISPNLSAKPLQSQTVATNGVQATSSATIGEPGPIENKEERSVVNSLPREDGSSTSQAEVNKDKTEALTPQVEVPSNNLPEVKADAHQTEVSPADSFHLPLTELAQPVSINDLPEPQVEPSVLPTEVLPSSASLYSETPPDAQVKPSDEQIEVSPVESLPVVASLCTVIPDSQEGLSEKQTEVTPEESLPVVASLCTIIPDSQEGLGENQTEVTSEEPLPVVASLCTVISDSQEGLSENQTEVTSEEPSPVVASHCTIIPDSQEELSEQQTEVTHEDNLPVVASLCTIIPDSQEGLSEKQTEVSHEDNLPVVASLCSIVPYSQDSFSEKQSEVTPEEPLPVVASLCTVVPDSQEELSKNQTEVTPEETLPEVASLSNITPDSQDNLSKNQSEVTPEEPSPVVASICSIVSDSQEGLSEKQTEVTPEEPLPDLASLPDIVPQAELTGYQTSPPIPHALPDVPPTTDLLGEQTEGQAQIQPAEAQPASASPCSAVYFESKIDDIGDQTGGLPVAIDVSAHSQAELPVESIPVPEDLLNGGSTDSQLSNFVIEPPNFDTLPTSVPVPDETSPKSELAELQSEVPSPEPIQKPVPLLTDSSQKVEEQPRQDQVHVVESQTSPVSFTLPEPSSHQTKVSSEAALPTMDFLSTESPPESQAVLDSNQAEVPPAESQTSLVSFTLPETSSQQTEVPAEAAEPIMDFLSTESPPKSQGDLSSNQAEVPPVETSSPSTVLPTDSSSGDQVITLPADLISVAPTTPELQEEPSKIHTEVPPSEPAALPLDDSLDSHVEPSEAQMVAPPVQCSPFTASFTADASCESSGELVNDQSETLPVPASILTSASSEPPADTYDGQPEILLSDIVLSLSDISCIESPPQGQTEPNDNPTDVPPVQPSILLPENEAVVPASVPVSLVESIVDQLENTAQENLADLPEPVEVMDIQVEFLPTEAETGSSSFTNIIPPDVHEETTDSPSEEVALLPTTSQPEPITETNGHPSELFSLVSPPSEVLPAENITDIALHPTTSQPELIAETNGHPSELSSLVSPPSEVLPAENITEIALLPTTSQPELIAETNGHPSESSSLVFPPSEALPIENITEVALLPTTSQPELIAETNGHPSELSSLVSPHPDQIAKSQEAPLEATSDVLKPDTFIASMVLCTDEAAEFSTEGQPPTVGFPSNISSDFSATPSEMPPSDPTSVELIGDGSSAVDATYLGLSVDSLLLPTNHSLELAADPNGNLLDIDFPPPCSSLLTDSSSEFLPPPPDPSYVDNTGLLEAPLFSDSLPATNVNLFEDPHPGSPPVSGGLIEPYRSEAETKTLAATENSSDKVIVHDILPVNNLPLEENQSPKDLAQCNSDSVNLSDSSAFANHKHSTLLPTEDNPQPTEDNNHENNNTVPSQVLQ